MAFPIPEEGTAASLMEDQIDEQVKKQRKEIIEYIQTEVADSISKNKVGRIQEVLIEGYDEIIKCYYGRTYADSPDVDGLVFFTGKKGMKLGDFVMVEITDAMDYDLFGKLVKCE